MSLDGIEKWNPEFMAEHKITSAELWRKYPPISKHFGTALILYACAMGLAVAQMMRFVYG